MQAFVLALLQLLFADLKPLENFAENPSFETDANRDAPPDACRPMTFESDPVRWGEVPAAATMFLRRDVAPARNEVHVVQTREDRLLLRPPTSEAKYTCQRFLTFTSKVRAAFIDDVYQGDADVAFCCGPSADATVEGAARVIRCQKRPWQEWLFPDFVAAARQLELPGYDQIPPGQKRFDTDTGQLRLDYGRRLFTNDASS